MYRRLHISLLWVFFLLATAVYGQQTEPSSTVPRLIKFSGVITNGAQHSGVTGVTFALYKEQQGGSPLWMETQNVTVDDRGNYVVVLGATQSDGVPLDLFVSGESRWLGIQSNAPDSQELPRILLVSVPYALKAADAETLGGKPASAYLLAPSADEKSSADQKSATESKAVKNTPTGTAVTSGGAIPKFDVDGTSLVNSVMSESNSSIAVGAGTPSAKLSVLTAGTERQFNTNAWADLSSNGGGAGFFGGNMFTSFSDGASRYANSHGAIGASGLAVNYPFWNQASIFVNAGPSTAGASFTPNIVTSFQSDGKVGIGTITPATTLDVTGTIRAALKISSPEPLGASLIPNYNGANGFRSGFGNNLFFDGANWRTGTDGVNNGGAGILTNIGDGALAVYTLPTTGGADQVVSNAAFSAAEKLRITTTGNLGIGTTVPSQKLEVAGNLKVSGNGNGVLFPDGSSLTSASPARIRAISYLAGCDTCSVLADTDDQSTIYQNVIGTMTINSVTCFSDTNTSAPVINLHRGGSGINVLSANLTCSTNPTPNTNIGDATLNLNDTLDFVMVTAGGSAKRVTVIIKTTVN